MSEAEQRIRQAHQNLAEAIHELHREGFNKDDLLTSHFVDQATKATMEERKKELEDIDKSWRRLKANIIASAYMLDKPFSNAPGQSRWTKMKSKMLALEAEIKSKKEGKREQPHS